MHKLRSTVKGTVILVLLGGMTGVVSAQEVEPVGPLEPGGASIFTMRQVGGEEVPWPASMPGPDGSITWEGPTDVWHIESSDPRLSGTYTLFGSGQAWPLDEAGMVLATVMTGSVRIENEEGAWTGTRIAYVGPDRADQFQVRGEGAYEGLTALFHWEDVIGDEVTDEAFMTYSGVVIPGPLPDYPEPSSE